MTRIRDDADDIVNPFNRKYNLKVTPWIALPSFIFLTASTALLLYIIYKHFRSLLEIYISVVLYLVSQLLLLVTLSGSWIVELVNPEESQVRCHVKLALQAFTMILPGYSILIISIVRSVFLTYPLTYLHYLQLRIQLLGFAAVCLVCGLISAAPLFGLCPAEQRIAGTGQSKLKFCAYGDKRKQPCAIFYSTLLALGFLLPVLAVIALYAYIYRVALRARKAHKQLSSASSTTSTETSSSRVKEKTERRSVPWSIIAILVVSVATTLPWAAMMLFTTELTEMLADGGDISVLFDLFYSLLQVLISCSPLVYLLTSNSLRILFIGTLRKAWQCTFVNVG